jgi:hypothetical protein|nr:carboxypeptidase-like regulatory domain-containing protein [Kofleriaceae bacterium]
MRAVAIAVLVAAASAHADALQSPGSLDSHGPRLAVTVVDRAGAPVAGVTVGDPAQVTGADGRVSLDTPFGRPDTWFFVSAPGYASQQVAMAITRDPNATVGVLVVVEPAVAVSGRVVDDRGHPIAGAEVVAKIAAVPTARSWIDRAATDDDGRWQLRDVAAASHLTFEATAPCSTSAGKRTLVVPPEGAADLDLSVTVGTRVEGVVLDAAGQPVADARISMMPSGRQRYSHKNGRFSFGCVTADTIAIDARTASLGAATHVLDVAHQRRVAVRLAMVPSAVAGVIATRTGRAVTDATVTLAGPLDDGGSLEHVSQARVDAAGHFEFHDLTPGRYVLELRRDSAHEARHRATRGRDGRLRRAVDPRARPVAGRALAAISAVAAALEATTLDAPVAPQLAPLDAPVAPQLAPLDAAIVPQLAALEATVAGRARLAVIDPLLDALRRRGEGRRRRRERRRAEGDGSDQGLDAHNDLLCSVMDSQQPPDDESGGCVHLLAGALTPRAAGCCRGRSSGP